MYGDRGEMMMINIYCLEITSVPVSRKKVREMIQGTYSIFQPCLAASFGSVSDSLGLTICICICICI